MSSISENQKFKDFIDGLHAKVMEQLKGDTTNARIDISLIYQLESGAIKASMTGFSIVANEATQTLGVFTV